jgi:2',3'-cyclic-nucleotide 2'-phosphodiesterase (5'-nucleotidase family)
MSLKLSIIYFLLVTLVSSHPKDVEISPLQTSTWTSRVTLDGNCRRSECNFGNFVADAIVDWNALRYTGSDGWTDSAIALVDASTIKLITLLKGNLNPTSVDQLLEGTKIVTLDVTGQNIKDALEHAVDNYDVHSKANYDKFLQVSGLIVEFDLTNPVGERVTSLEVICADCESPIIFEINLTRSYRILVSETIADGTHGYSMFAGKTKTDLGVTDKEIIAPYLAKKSPIYPAVEWRLTINSNAAITKISTVFVFASILLSMVMRNF